MDNNECHLEDNIARLIHAGLSPRARPDSIMKEHTWRQLVANLHTESTAITFPDWILVVLAGILVFMGGWFASQTLGVDVPAVTNKSLPIVALILAVNIVWVPTAGIIIVRRIRYV